MHKEVQLKGTNFRGAMSALEQLAGKAAVERVLAEMQGPAAEAMRNGEIVASGWYPASWYAALLEAIDTTTKRGPMFFREISREAVRQDLSTILKFVSFFVSPERALDNATKIMARYYQGGRIAVLEARHGYLRFRFDEYYGLTWRMWEDIVGGMEGVLISMRVGTPKAKILEGGRDGSPHMVVEVTWQA